MKASNIGLLLLLGLFCLNISPLSAQVVREISSEVEIRGIAFSGSITVKVRVGGENSVKIIGDEDEIDDIEVSVNDGYVDISPKGQGWSWGGSDLVVEVSASALEKLSVAGSGEMIVLDPIEAEEFKISLAGSGELEIPVQAGKLYISIAGSGEIEATGSCEELKLSIAGSGDFEGRELAARTAKVVVSGSGDAEVNVSDSLYATVSGSGDISYLGNPEVKSQVGGSGEIRAMNP